MLKTVPLNMVQMIVIPTCHLLHQMATLFECLVAEQGQSQSMFNVSKGQLHIHVFCR